MMPSKPTCVVCDKKLSNQRRLEAHMNMHKGFHPFKCLQCDKMYYSNGGLERHSKIHLKRPDLSVRIYNVDKQRNFKSHISPKNRNFRGADSYREIYIKGHDTHNLNNFKGHQVPSERNIERHDTLGQKNTKGQETSAKTNCMCCKCGKAYLPRWSLRRHGEVHEKDGSYKNHRSSVNIKTENESTDGSNRFKEGSHLCSQCCRWFRTKSALEKHWEVCVNTHFPGSSRDDASLNKHRNACMKLTWPCELCGRKFQTEKGRNVHIYVHRTKWSMERLFKCSECGKKFKSRANLANHSVVHCERSKYDCPACQKSFSTRYQLNGHSWVHTSDRKVYGSCQVPYKPSNKGAQTKTRQTLSKKSFKQNLDSRHAVCCCKCKLCVKTNKCHSHHKELHKTTTYLYQCFMCKSKFKRKGQVKQHMSVHRYIYLFDALDSSVILSLCEIGYDAKRQGPSENTKSHCKKCSKSFSSLASLKKLRQGHH